MRKQYIVRHGVATNRVAAAFSVVDSSSNVVISQELVTTNEGEGGLVCAICHEMISFGERGRQLPCSHIFHYLCITKWFSSHTQISCPLCRDESR